MSANEQDISNRYLASLSDADLFSIFADRREMSSVNKSRANRECRRRAAKAGMASPYDWLGWMAAQVRHTAEGE